MAESVDQDFKEELALDECSDECDSCSESCESVEEEEGDLSGASLEVQIVSTSEVYRRKLLYFDMNRTGG